MTGFSPFKTTGVEVATNQVVRTNAKLQVGDLTDTVTVEAKAQVLDTDRATVSATINAARRSSSCRSTAATSGTWRPPRPASWAVSTATSA